MVTAERVGGECQIRPIGARSSQTSDCPCLHVLDQPPDAVGGHRADSEEGQPGEDVGQEGGSYAAVNIAAAKVKRATCDQGEHERLGNSSGLDQPLRLAEGEIKAKGQHRIEDAKNLD